MAQSNDLLYDRGMSKAIEQPSPDLALGIQQVRVAGGIIVSDFARPFADLPFEEKADRIRSLVGKTDVDASNAVVRGIAGATGEKTITEEYERVAKDLLQFVASYDEDNVWCLDPLDGTKNFRDAIDANPDLDPSKPPRISLAMVSLAKIIGGRPRVGTLLAPVLGAPARLYAAEEDQGAFLEIEGGRTELKVDSSNNSGLVLVSENNHSHIDQITQHKGLTFVRLGGMVFKMLCVSDPALIRTYVSRLDPATRRLLANEPIVGTLSNSAALHDFAAASVVNRESGAIVTATNGDKQLSRGKGEHGIIVANNARIHGILVDAMHSEIRSS